MDDREVTGLVEELEHRVLRVVRFLFLFFGLPAALLFALIDSFTGQALSWLWFEVLLIGVASFVLWTRNSRRTKVTTLVITLVLIAGFALLRFGPTIGTGLFFFTAALCAAFFMSARGLLWVVVSLVGLMVAIAVATVAGVVHPKTLVPTPVEWLRMLVSTVGSLVACALIFGHIQRSMRAALSAELQARQREQNTQLERGKILRAAENVQRLEALGRLAGGVAHDFNNALFVIQTSAELLAMTKDESERQQLLGEIQGGIKRAMTTARQLLAFGKGALAETGICRPHTQLGLLASSVARLLPANVKLDVQTTPTAAINVAAGIFEQVILNLLLNARDAMPEGGEIRIACREQEGRVSLEVRDTGAGMAAEVKAHIFEPFFTTKGERGTGLGLSMVWGVVNRAGGTIEVDSTPGEGTTFRIALPVADQVEEGVVLGPSTRIPAGATGARVLLLEDQLDVQRMMRRILEREGFVVDAVALVSEARALIAGGAHALFITDGMVPDAPVGPAIADFRLKHPGAPVILCSGHVENDLTLGNVACDGMRALPKPFSAQALVTTVREMLAPTN